MIKTIKSDQDAPGNTLAYFIFLRNYYDELFAFKY